MEILKIVNWVIAVLFFLCYAYQFVYIPLAWILKKKRYTFPVKRNRFAVLICARNEEAVLPELIQSIHNQTYPQELIHIFVMADNCTDDTAIVAREAGATVYARKNKDYVGKGYAMDALLLHIRRDYPEGFDGYLVLDADNLLKEDYLDQINITFSEGHDIVTSYRNSKNFGSNWISSGYALYFLRESRYLNYVRSMLGTSCAVSGTGFVFSRKIADELNGWPYHMLTEDIEFSIDQIVKGRKVAFCEKAELYDEQPIKFSQSWHQRMRWTRGYMQVFQRYGKDLVKGIFRGSFDCFDMSMLIMPAFILSDLSLLCNLFLCGYAICNGQNLVSGFQSVGQLLLNMSLMLWVVSGTTIVSEWKHINAKPWQKILYGITFPLYMFTYIPISLAALVKDPGWKPIAHTQTESMLKDNLQGIKRGA